ncbi:hypothetical protein [Alicycliphilus denitrificans]|uniref:Uncharacterized protein n=1 Tax=Alicycliphilus denitrificans (strain DSM 14773 / CIP 107495 / K601) TaxID=596154 RepID=F4GGH4_ALIDK|nr:hypothetical protein [Alicycliphilus denitrificans]AEB85128.1 hypothetical protein Alide2_2779 [Alicycliphilus denitrificans K601]
MSFNLGTPPVGLPPYSPWTARHLRTIERAIAIAWGRLMSQPAFVAWVQTAIERDITIQLQKQLVLLLNTNEVRGFSAAFFAPPIRGQEVENHSGSEKEKRPDLTFHRLAARPVDTQNAQFYECKIIGRGRTLDDYHDEGVMRFVDGRYAWAMPHAGMIAYVSPPPPAVADVALSGYWTKARSGALASGLLTGKLQVDAATGPTVAISIHQRTFPLPDQQHPGDIALRHLWLSAVE